MCGFVTQICLNQTRPNKNKVASMLKLIKHRGPDSTNLKVYDRVCLGFNRLSILDLSKAANQPMNDETGRFSIVYNGELYNFKTLQKILKLKGYTFFTASDTEVLLKSYIEWGEKCLSMFEGMFAFCIYDKQTKEVFIARDQLGIKPLYYYKSQSTIFFVSEIKALINVISLKLNYNKIGEYFRYGYIADESTLFKNVNKIPPGYFMKVFKNGNILKKKYFDIKDSFSEQSNNIDLKNIETKVNQSILDHTVSDVGFNIQLSGGLDSSYITAVLRSKLEKKVNTYSIVVDFEKENEEKYQSLVAKKFNTNHYPVHVSHNDYADLLEKATWHMDLPILHAGCPFLMHLTKFSRKTSKVILTGEGADELFGGYSRYKLTMLQKIAYYLKKINLSKDFIPSYIPKLRGIKKIMEMDIGVDDHIINRDISKFLLKTKYKNNFKRNYLKNIDPWIKKIFLNDQRFYLSTLLERQDKMSMAYSVESRVPFSNITLFKVLNKINSRKKVEPSLKYLLKKISSKYFSESFINRRKNGFRLPIDKWIRKKGKMNQMLSLLTDQTFSERGLFKKKEINKMIDDHMSEKENNTKELFSILKFEIWHRLFID
tara:strand:- start:477 stop:2276 length:1800 start_codon:yes stop_codon:yes gene_type:complete